MFSAGAVVGQYPRWPFRLGEHHLNIANPEARDGRLWRNANFRRLGADEWFTYVLYFGYMGLICVGLFLLTGTCGFLACLWFTKKIYASIKVD